MILFPQDMLMLNNGSFFFGEKKENSNIFDEKLNSIQYKLPINDDDDE